MTNRVRLTSYLLDMIGSIIEKVLVGPPSWSLATLIKFREYLKNWCFAISYARVKSENPGYDISKMLLPTQLSLVP